LPQDGLKMAPRWFQYGSKWPQDGFQRAHDGPQKVQDIFELASTWPQKVNMASKRLTQTNVDKSYPIFKLPLPSHPHNQYAIKHKPTMKRFGGIGLSPSIRHLA
jgi:hypothetical protein